MTSTNNFALSSRGSLDAASDRPASSTVARESSKSSISSSSCSRSDRIPVDIGSIFISSLWSVVTLCVFPMIKSLSEYDQNSHPLCSDWLTLIRNGLSDDPHSVAVCRDLWLAGVNEFVEIVSLLFEVTLHSTLSPLSLSYAKHTLAVQYHTV